ncbi:MAG: putative molybdenum carrier protein [Phycisphaerales bacterium]|nr:MAG: putative molybdenum carrier protein [Phycisphaerales bacterium]
MKPIRIISGGQTGVDRAALDVALQLNLDCGGFCPAGRAAEDGPIPAHYPLQETESADPAIRTDLNVRDSDATLIISPTPLQGGTALTEQRAGAQSRPCLVIDPTDSDATEKAGAWLDEHNIQILNIAGPRESESPGIHDSAAAFLLDLFGNLHADNR